MASDLPRRAFLRASLYVAAMPIIVRAGSLMPVRALPQGWPYYGGMGEILVGEIDPVTKNRITRWEYDDGTRKLGLGFVIPRGALRPVTNQAAMMMLLRNVAEYALWWPA